ncbi:lasso RiPP family leader peptide-containing protein [Risungbinella massiliensis]|nr:lasso RiPP family leader peptide-containing protein [Risungbinella massiliensis]
MNRMEKEYEAPELIEIGSFEEVTHGKRLVDIVDEHECQNEKE